MNREGAPAKSPEEMYIQQKEDGVKCECLFLGTSEEQLDRWDQVGGLLGTGTCFPHHHTLTLQLTASEEEFLRTYAGVVSSQLSQLPQHSIDQGAEDVVMAFSRSETEDRRQ
ncbi:beta-catenin-interacting protein 1 [Sigmodon hispidus]